MANLKEKILQALKYNKQVDMVLDDLLYLKKIY